MKYYQLKIKYNELVDSPILINSNQNNTGFMALSPGLPGESVYMATKDTEILVQLSKNCEIIELDNTKVLTAYGCEKNEFLGNEKFFTDSVILNLA